MPGVSGGKAVDRPRPAGAPCDTVTQLPHTVPNPGQVNTSPATFARKR